MNSSNKNITYLKNCILCGNENLEKVVHINEQYISSTFVKSNENNDLTKIRTPLTLVLCSENEKKRISEIEKEQKEALDEIKKTKRTLLEMTAKKGNLGGPVVFQMWWFQLTAGLQMQEDNLVWLEE